MSTHAARAMLGAALAFAGVSCAAQEKPGELVGVYSIVGALTENTCGTAALPAPDPLEFEVELRRVEAGGLWLLGMPPGSPGSLEEDGEFVFTSESTFSTSAPQDNASTELLEMDPLALANLDTFETFEQADQPQSCTLLISEEVRGTVIRDGRISAHASAKGPAPAGDEDDPDLLGENVIAVRAGGGDCSIVMVSNGGPFDTLPCRAHYDIAGAVLDDE